MYLDAEARGFDAAFEEVRKNHATVMSSKIHDAVNMRGSASYEEIRDHLIIRPLKRWGMDGAAALFYLGVVAKMMKVMGGAFRAVFMNINDVMIFSRGDRRADSCARAAKTGGGQAEILSSRIYLCSEQGVNPA